MLGSSVQYKLVDISMEGMVGQIEQLVHSLPIIVDVLALVSEFVVVAVFPCENASSARVQQITRLFLAMTRNQTGNDCLCRFYVVGSIGGIWCPLLESRIKGCGLPLILGNEAYAARYLQPHFLSPASLSHQDLR